MTTGKLATMEPGNLEARVTALETQVHELTERVRATEHDAAAARVLAGAADRDVSEFSDELREFSGELREFRGEFGDFRQATVASFDALREDFGDLRAEFGDLRTNVDRGFIEMRGKFDAAAAGQQQIVELIQTLITGQGPAK